MSQKKLNKILEKQFNGNGIDLDSIEFQYYFNPSKKLNGNRNAIVSAIKAAFESVGYKCSNKNHLNVEENRNTLVGGGIKSLRQRKVLISTSGDSGVYDRTVKILINDLKKYVKASVKEDNKKEKLEINRVTKKTGKAIDVNDILCLSSKYTDDTSFICLDKQNEINKYFNNVKASIPIITKNTYLSKTMFKVEIEDIKTKVDVQLCYNNIICATNGEAELDINGVQWRFSKEGKAFL